MRRGVIAAALAGLLLVGCSSKSPEQAAAPTTTSAGSSSADSSAPAVIGMSAMNADIDDCSAASDEEKWLPGAGPEEP